MPHPPQRRSLCREEVGWQPARTPAFYVTPAPSAIVPFILRFDHETEHVSRVSRGCALRSSPTGGEFARITQRDSLLYCPFKPALDRVILGPDVLLRQVRDSLGMFVSVPVYLSIQTSTALWRAISDVLSTSIARSSSGNAFWPMSSSATGAGTISRPNPPTVSSPSLCGRRKSKSLTSEGIACSYRSLPSLWIAHVTQRPFSSFGITELRN